MEFLPTTLGTRPRLAVEIRAEGIIAARAEDAAALLAAVSRTNVAEGGIVPGLRPGNIVDRAGVIVAIRTALENVGGRGAERSAGRDVTVIVPDAAARVLLLDFDQLPSKAAEALPVVRFRLKKLLPFDADGAAVSYQVMSSERGGLRVLAVAMPKEVLSEYEGAVTAAGYLPGAVLPSTLAALAGLDTSETPVLVVNTGSGGVTTAIVKGGLLLLHRSLDLSRNTENAMVSVGTTPVLEQRSGMREGMAPEGYDRFDAEAAMQTSVLEKAQMREAEMRESRMTVVASLDAREVAQTVSVAAAYFEDTLKTLPEKVLVGGTMDADALTALMEANGLEGLQVQEMVDAGMLEASAVSMSVPRCWLAGVRGALKN